MILYAHLFWLLFSFLMLSCKHETFLPVQLPAIPEDSNSSKTPVDTVTFEFGRIYFVNDVQPIINSNCATSGCHDPQTKTFQVDLSTYDRVIKTSRVESGNPENSMLYSVLITTDPTQRMPPAGPLPSKSIAVIEKWIEQGARNDFYLSGCDTSNLRFSSNIRSIIDSNCKSCHNASNPQGGYDFTNHSGIKAAVNDNKLEGVIEHALGFKPMPPGNKIPDCDVAKIKRWIINGALDN